MLELQAAIVEANKAVSSASAAGGNRVLATVNTGGLGAGIAGTAGAVVMEISYTLQGVVGKLGLGKLYNTLLDSL